MNDPTSPEMMAAHARVDRALVAIMVGEQTATGALTRLDGGSGVLVSLGGKRFVLTAAHNLVDDDGKLERTISVYAPPRGLLMVSRLGDGSARSAMLPRAPDARGDIEPDVAAIDLTDNVALRSDCEPFTEEEIGWINPDASGRAVILAGFPKTYIDVQPKQELAPIGTHLPIWSSPVSLLTQSLPGRRAEKEPKRGRGIHVHIPPTVHFEKRGGQEGPTPSTQGTSGGPLVLVEDKPTLIGLVRSRTEEPGGGHDQWCEPVIEAIGLLTRHEDPAVVAAARRIVERVTRLAKG